MEDVVSRPNMMAALERVEANKGAPGIDAMTTGELRGFLREKWPAIREELLNGTYHPQPVRKVEIEKPGGGVRTLGIPTVCDRLIQQALHQVLTPLFDPDFSDSSYGYRPGRSAWQAVKAARRHVADGKRWVVDLDLEKFFDRVNHDILMSRVARKVRDKRVLLLIRRYLQAGVLEGGLVSQRVEGTPQGGPLSPFCRTSCSTSSTRNWRGAAHAFCRYADDCNIYVQTRRSGERVMASLTRFLEERLALKVNVAKSAVDRPWKRVFLGYSMTFHKKPRLKVAAASVKRFKARLRKVCRRGRGRSHRSRSSKKSPRSYGGGSPTSAWRRSKASSKTWTDGCGGNCAAFCGDSGSALIPGPRGLMQRGLTEARAWKSATNGRGPWWNAGASHMNEAYPTSFFRYLGLIRLTDQHRRFQSAL